MRPGYATFDLLPLLFEPEGLVHLIDELIACQVCLDIQALEKQSATRNGRSEFTANV